MPRKPNCKPKEEVDQNDESLPRCLGWCGRLRFKPKFKHARYCDPCSKEKERRQAGLSMRQEEELSFTNESRLPAAYTE